MKNSTILVIEDEEDIRDLIVFSLKSKGFQCLEADNGKDGLQKALSMHPDLILLDLMLPGMDGFEICKSIRSHQEGKNLPIIILSARGEETDIVRGLELGADDYVSKPFSPKVLHARIRSVLRRWDAKPTLQSDDVLSYGDLVISLSRHEVKLNQEEIPLSATEFNILSYLVQRPGWVFTRNQIIEAVKGDDYPVTDRSVDVQILGIRKKLGDFAQNIETVRGVGYRVKQLD